MAAEGAYNQCICVRCEQDVNIRDERFSFLGFETTSSYTALAVLEVTI